MAHVEESRRRREHSSGKSVVRSRRDSGQEGSSFVCSIHPDSRGVLWEGPRHERRAQNMDFNPCVPDPDAWFQLGMVLRDHQCAFAFGAQRSLGSSGLMWSPGTAGLLTRLLFQGNLRGHGWGWGAWKFQIASWWIPIAYASVVYLPLWILGYGKFHREWQPKWALHTGIPGDSCFVIFC